MQRLHVCREHNNWFGGHCIGWQLVSRSILRCYFWPIKPFTIWHLDISRIAFSSQIQSDRLDFSEREFCNTHSFRYAGIWGEETLLLHPQYYGMAFLWKLDCFPLFLLFWKLSKTQLSFPWCDLILSSLFFLVLLQCNCYFLIFVL